MTLRERKSAPSAPYACWQGYSTLNTEPPPAQLLRVQKAEWEVGGAKMWTQLSGPGSSHTLTKQGLIPVLCLQCRSNTYTSLRILVIDIWVALPIALLLLWTGDRWCVTSFCFVSCLFYCVILNLRAPLCIVAGKVDANSSTAAARRDEQLVAELLHEWCRNKKFCRNVWIQVDGWRPAFLPPRHCRLFFGAWDFQETL